MQLLLLGDEPLDLVPHLVGERDLQRRLRSIAAAIDPRPVHGDEEAGVGILVEDRRDHRPIEGEMRGDLDVQEVARSDPLAVEGRRPLPDRPTVIVARGGDDDRCERRRRREAVLVAPGARELRREVGVVRLEHDLPRVAPIPDDHRSPPRSRTQGTSPPASARSRTSGCTGSP